MLTLESIKQGWYEMAGEHSDIDCLSVSCDWACGQRDWDVPATTPKTNWEDGSFHKLRILSGGVIDEVYSTWCVTDGYKTIVKIKVEDWRGDPLLIEKYYYLDFAEGKAIARSDLKKLGVDDVDSDRDAITRAFKRLEGLSVDLECWATMHFVYYNIFNMNGTQPKSQ